MFKIFKKQTIKKVTAADLDKLNQELLAYNQKMIDAINKK